MMIMTKMTKRGWRSNDGSITSVDPGNLLVPPIFTKLYQVTHVQYQVTHVLTLKWLTQTNIIVMASLVACWIIHLPPPYINLHTTQGSYKSMPGSIYICTFKTNLHWLVCRKGVLKSTSAFKTNVMICRQNHLRTLSQVKQIETTSTQHVDSGNQWFMNYFPK